METLYAALSINDTLWFSERIGEVRKLEKKTLILWPALENHPARECQYHVTNSDAEWKKCGAQPPTKRKNTRWRSWWACIISEGLELAVHGAPISMQPSGSCQCSFFPLCSLEYLRKQLATYRQPGSRFSGRNGSWAVLRCPGFSSTIQKQLLSSGIGFSRTYVRNVKERNMSLCQGMLRKHLQNGILQTVRAKSEAWSTENRQLCF